MNPVQYFSSHGHTYRAPTDETTAWWPPRGPYLHSKVLCIRMEKAAAAMELVRIGKDLPSYSLWVSNCLPSPCVYM